MEDIKVPMEKRNDSHLYAKLHPEEIITNDELARDFGIPIEASNDAAATPYYSSSERE